AVSGPNDASGPLNGANVAIVSVLPLAPPPLAPPPPCPLAPCCGCEEWPLLPHAAAPNRTADRIAPRATPRSLVLIRQPPLVTSGSVSDRGTDDSAAECLRTLSYRQGYRLGGRLLHDESRRFDGRDLERWILGHPPCFEYGLFVRRH